MSAELQKWLAGPAEQLPGDVEVSPGPGWEWTALRDRDLFTKNLEDAGFPAAARTDALILWDRTVSDMSVIEAELAPYRYVSFLTSPPELNRLYQRRFEVGQRLLNILKGREFRVNSVTKEDLRIPIFTLGAATEPGCRSQFEIREDATASIDCTVTLFGTGLGGTASIRASAVAKFSCESGELKVVFVPITVPVERITLIEKGKPVAEGWRIDASRAQRTGAPGVRLLPPDAVVAAGALAERYPLREDASGAIAEYSYEYAASSKVGPQVGVNISGVNLTLSTTIELGKSATLTFGLRGGFDYRLHFPDEGQGAIWAKPVSY